MFIFFVYVFLELIHLFFPFVLSFWPSGDRQNNRLFVEFSDALRFVYRDFRLFSRISRFFFSTYAFSLIDYYYLDAQLFVDPRPSPPSHIPRNIFRPVVFFMVCRVVEKSKKNANTNSNGKLGLARFFPPP